MGRRLGMEEALAFSGPATLVHTNAEHTGELLLGFSRIFFVPEIGATGGSLSLPLSELKEIHRRLYQLRDLALELFTAAGDSYFVSFESNEVQHSTLMELPWPTDWIRLQKREQFLNRLLFMDIPSLRATRDNILQSVSQAWREGVLTNYEYCVSRPSFSPRSYLAGIPRYLMELNKLAGRTSADLMQYPVMPFILADYTSLHLDLGKATVYRELARPMAVQDAAMEDHYRWVHLPIPPPASLSRT